MAAEPLFGRGLLLFVTLNMRDASDKSNNWSCHSVVFALHLLGNQRAEYGKLFLVGAPTESIFFLSAEATRGILTGEVIYLTWQGL